MPFGRKSFEFPKVRRGHDREFAQRGRSRLTITLLGEFGKEHGPWCAGTGEIRGSGEVPVHPGAPFLPRSLDPPRFLPAD
jgi:hypothetical protein